LEISFSKKKKNPQPKISKKLAPKKKKKAQRKRKDVSNRGKIHPPKKKKNP
jgi:hypothetical protein